MQSLYVVQEGTLECYRKGLYVNTVSRGDVFGELSLVYGVQQGGSDNNSGMSGTLQPVDYNLPRTASVYLSSDKAVVWQLSKHDFDAYIREDPLAGPSNPKFFPSYDSSGVGKSSSPDTQRKTKPNSEKSSSSQTHSGSFDPKKALGVCLMRYYPEHFGGHEGAVKHEVG